MKKYHVRLSATQTYDCIITTDNPHNVKKLATMDMIENLEILNIDDYQITSKIYEVVETKNGEIHKIKVGEIDDN